MKAMYFMKKGWRANLAAIIMMALVVSSCTKEPRCEEPKEPQKECKLKGKFERAVCGWGVYESYWIRLDDGTFLQPCESDVALLDIKTIYEGMPVELSYVPTSKQCGMLACAAWPGEHITVKITCIKGGKPADPSGCNHTGTLRDMRGGKLDGCSWLIDLDNGQRLDLGEQVDANVYKDGDRVTIGYTEIQNVWNSCMSGLVVQLDCITKEGTTPPPPTGKCEHTGTLRDLRNSLDGCGWAIELDNGGGTLDVDAQVDASVYKDGDRVKVGYEVQYIANDCMHGTPAKLTCIQKDDSEPTGKCEHMGTLHDMRSKTYGCGWVLELLDGTKLDVSGQIDENIWGDGSVVLVGYEEVINVWNPCNADKAVQLTCIRTANHSGRQ